MEKIISTLMTILLLFSYFSLGLFEDKTPLENLLVTLQAENRRIDQREAKRFNGYLPTSPSEDMTHILHKPEIHTFVQQSNYYPDFFYAIHLKGKHTIKDIKKFYKELIPKLSHKTRILVGQGPVSWYSLDEFPDNFEYSQWLFCLNLVDDNFERVTMNTLEQFNQAVFDLAQKYDFLVTPFETLDKAEEKAKTLVRIKQNYDVAIELKLVVSRNRPITGPAIHDASLALGLPWTQGMYIWPSDNSKKSSILNAFFYVCPLNKLYFEPKDMIAEDYTISGITCFYPFARTKEPVQVFENMLKAIQYYQTRFGGTIIGPRDITYTDKQINDLLEKVKEMDFLLRELGFFPGHPKILTFLNNDY